MTVADVHAAAVAQMRAVKEAAEAKRLMLIAVHELTNANDRNRVEKAQAAFDARAKARVAAEMAKAAERIYRAECRRVDLPTEAPSAQGRLFDDA